MSLRIKIALALVALSVAATIAIGVGTFTGMRASLDAEVNRSLDDFHHDAGEDNHYNSDPRFADRGDRGASRLGLERISEQFITGAGELVNRQGTLAIPIDATAKRVARTQTPSVLVRRDILIGHELYRVDTVSRGGGAGAGQFARSLEESRRLLHTLRNRTLIAVVFILVLAGSAGWWIARQVTNRLTRLTTTAEHVAKTGALDVSAPVGGNDEAGRLGAAFNEMLVALSDSKTAQQQLVQDAGHELRTPLTSLRTNIALLSRLDALTPQEQSDILADLKSETQELSLLVNELVELATDQRTDEANAEVELGAIVAACEVRARRRCDNPINIDTDDSIVFGQSGRLDRAIANLIDNAIKFSPSGSPIDISVREGRVTVADLGPGIPASERPKIFERFYRTDDARSRPGSGLGLAIVADIVTDHHGVVLVEARDGGGTVIGFTLPTISHPPHTEAVADPNLRRR